MVGVVRRTRRLSAIAIGLTLLVTACTQAPTGEGGASPGASEKPVAGGRVIEGSSSDIKTMNPILVNDSPSDVVTSLLFDSLVGQDPKTGEPKPRMATWTQSSDGKTYNFEIDAKANWSDGKPVTGEDYLTGVKAIAKSKKSPRRGNFVDLDGFADF